MFGIFKRKKEEAPTLKEIHKTEFVDKQLPGISFEESIIDSMTSGRTTKISVSDRSSADALKTFEKVREGLKK